MDNFGFCTSQVNFCLNQCCHMSSPRLPFCFFSTYSKYLFVTISRKQLVFLVLPFWTSEVSVIIELIDDVSDSATHTHRRNES
uniref:Uncharacterized protein n=1 Tax=Lepeophtheirus salmonis TaxID=72036 RepID=A0A0K2VA46_LEPSM